MSSWQTSGRIARGYTLEPEVADLDLGDFRIEPHPVEHTSHPTYGYLIHAGNRRVGWVPEFWRFPSWAAGVDLLFADAAGWRQEIRFARGVGGHAAALDTSTEAKQRRSAPARLRPDWAADHKSHRRRREPSFRRIRQRQQRLSASVPRLERLRRRPIPNGDRPRLAAVGPTRQSGQVPAVEAHDGIVFQAERFDDPRPRGRTARLVIDVTKEVVRSGLGRTTRSTPIVGLGPTLMETFPRPRHMLFAAV